MPTTFPPGFPTVDATGVETISRFLNTPTLVQRALRTMTEQRFISDVLLSGRVPPSGGAVLYETSESIFAARTPLEAIAPGAEYPLTTVGAGVASIATVKKWGVDTKVTFESVMRLRMNPVDRAFIKLANTVIRQIDSNGLAAINAASIQTMAAAAAWTATANILADLLNAVALVVALNQGYQPDTLVLSDTKFAALMSNTTVQTAMRREDMTNPIYTGQMGRVAGLDVMVTNNGPDSTAAYVLDRKLLGSISDEVPLTSNSWWIQDTEEWRLRSKRVTVPFVQEPQACVKVTGI